MGKKGARGRRTYSAAVHVLVLTRGFLIALVFGHGECAEAEGDECGDWDVELHLVFVCGCS